MQSKQPKRQLPVFESAEQEAVFWDRRDSEDFVSEWRKTRLRFGPALRHVLSVRLEPETIARLAEIGRGLGIGPSTLVRMWVLEKLATATKGVVSEAPL